MINRNFTARPNIYQKKRKTAPNIEDTITPKNRRSMRVVDGEQIRLNETLRAYLTEYLK